MPFTSSPEQPIRYLLEGCLFQLTTIPFGIVVDWIVFIPGILYESENYHDLWHDAFEWNQKWIRAYNNFAELWEYEAAFNDWRIRQLAWNVFVNPFYY